MDASVRRILLAGDDRGERGGSYELASHVRCLLKFSSCSSKLTGSKVVEN